MFRKILVANRGEIAVRVTRTAQRLGIGVVAVYSEADRSALHVKMADEAVFIGPAPVVESYLQFDRIIRAAQETGAEAIHPGYGFLSENADFAEALEREAITFIGPASATIRAMGIKSTAKDLMEQAGVATLPGYQGADQSLQTFKREAARIGYPILLKAVAGGGGKGMRLVEDESMMAEARDAAIREAKSSFGDGRLLVEKLLLHPRHLEVQIFGDGEGRVVHLFDRDCSVQRRHQKILEEAPAVGLSPAVRAKLLEAGVAAGKAVNYCGAGTIEFLYDGVDDVYFMEMNTRLQVEHPVSEEITGIDFVEWQLRIAAGEGLPLTQDQITESGHAFEARLYAEDPYNNFAPSTGKLSLFRLPEQVRNDSGVEEGQEITTYYDSMISKIITHASTRVQALSMLEAALAKTRIAGLKTNVQFLHAICAEPDFVSGNIATSFIEQHEASLFACKDFGIAPVIAAGIWRLGLSQTATENASPWLSLPSWRMNQPVTETIWIVHQGDISRLALTIHAQQIQGVLESAASAAARRAARRATRKAGRRDRGEAPEEIRFDCSIIEVNGNQVKFDYQGVQHVAFVAPHHCGVRVWFGAECTDVEFSDVVSVAGTQKTAQGSLTAPMPGTIVGFNKAVGEEVALGETLLILEAMKMEHAITAPEAGVIKKFPFAIGQQVKEGDMLVELETSDSPKDAG